MIKTPVAIETPSVALFILKSPAANRLSSKPGKKGDYAANA